ncbi:MAG TPA: hypothetical protein DEA08_02145 [Planctomycetes bacterium]|nr:hypothetical protein [Planctomycetota bacterium]
MILFRKVLDQDEHLLVEKPDAREGDTYRLLGVSEWAIRSLRKLPPAGKLVFREKYDYRAQSAIDKALKAKSPYLALARAYELYPIASQAPQILSIMAERCLERGELERARKVLRRLLAHHADELEDPTPVHKKLLVCALGLGDPVQVREQAELLRKLGGGDEVHLGQTPMSVPELVASALEREAARTGRYRGASPSTPMARGDTRNRAAFEGEPSFGSVLLSPREFSNQPRWKRPLRLRPGRFGNRNDFPARNLAVVHEGLVFTTSADELHAFPLGPNAPKPRRLRRPPNRAPYEDDNEKVQFGPTVGQGVLVAPFVERVQYDQSFRGIPIKVRIPTRKLCGFDLEEWRWSWDHARQLQGTPLQGWSFPATPTAHEGRVYASGWSIEGYVNANVACFDLRTGEPIWWTLSASGQVEQTMFGEQAMEPLCVPLALHDGVIYQPTSLGCVAALDADTGRPLWVTEYDAIEVRPPQGYYADRRNIIWENTAPVVEDGTLVVAPLDSTAFYGFDLATGKRTWKAAQRLGRRGDEGEVRYVMGAKEGRIVLAGGHDVRCVEVRSGRLRWRQTLNTPTVAGRGCIVGRTVCVPLDDGTVVTYDLMSGKRRGSHKLAIPGNLLPVGRATVVVGNGSLAVHGSGGSGARRDFK